MLRKIALAAIGLVNCLSFAAAQTPTELTFGIISTEASVNQKQNWEPFIEAMARATGFAIKTFYATDYAGVIEAMRFNKVQVAWFGNKSAMEAVDRANGEVFAAVVDKDGSTGYYSLIVVRADSPFNRLDDILACDRKLNFGIGDPNSTSGFLVPTAYIFAARNIDPKNCFKTVRNASHQANAMAVAHRQLDAATTNNIVLQQLADTDPGAHAQIKIIWTSPVIPLDPLVWRKDLDAGIKAKLYTFLLSYGRLGSNEEIAADRRILARMIWSAFNPSSDRQLLSTRKLEANKTLLKVQGDDSLSAADKATQIADIKATIVKIEDLEKQAADDPYQKRITDFIAADNAGDKEKIKAMIAAFAAGFANTN